MNTKKKQPRKPQSQPRKLGDLQSKKNLKGGTGGGVPLVGPHGLGG